MKNFITEGKKLFEEYIAEHFNNENLLNVNLSRIDSPCPEIDKTNKTTHKWSENPLYFTDGKDVYVIHEVPRGYNQEDLFVLEKAVLDKVYQKGEENKLRHFQSLQPEIRKTSGGNLCLGAFLDEKDYRVFKTSLK